MKKLVVRFIGPVRRPGPERTLEIAPDGLATVSELLLRLGYDPSELPHLTVLIDGSRKNLDSPLADARNVEILVALGGG
jgi:hypothetical protein